MTEEAVQTAAPSFRIVPGTGTFARAELIEGESGCPLCDGTGRRLVDRDGYTFVRPCDCREVRNAVGRFNAARIPRILGTRTLERRTEQDRGPDRFRPYTAEQQRAFEQVRTFVDGYGASEEPARGFVLMGKVGTGKSHLLVGALRRLIFEKGVQARYIEFFHLLSDLKEGYSQGKSEREIIAPLTEIEVLAIDELGKGRGTDWELYVLDEIISRRYNAGRVTLFATNYTPHKETTVRDRAAARSGYVSTRGRAFQDEMLGETLEQRVGERIYSRLNEMCELLLVDGPDYRQAAYTDRGGLGQP